MRLRGILALLAAASLWPMTAAAVTPQDYELETAQDLVDLCSVTPADPQAEQAINYCYGFVSGAMDYHRAVAAGPDYQPIVCPPEPPTNREVVEFFLEWMQDPANRQYLSEPPVEVLLFAGSREFPCE